MGWTHIDVEEKPPAPLDTSNDQIRKLTELLEWERKQRAEAQAKVVELDDELQAARLEAVKEQRRLREALEGERAKAG